MPKKYKKKLLTIFLTFTPDKCKNSKLLLNLIKLGMDKGYKVVIFASGDGVYNFVQTGKYMKNFQDLYNNLENLLNEGLKVKICNVCIINREIKEQLLMPKTEITGIAELFYLMRKSERFIKMGC